MAIQITHDERMMLAKDPKNQMYDILVDKYGMSADDAWRMACNICGEETIKAAKRAGFSGTYSVDENMEFDRNSLILEGFFAGEMDLDDARIDALFAKYGLDSHKSSAALMSSYEFICDIRRLGDGAVFVAGSEYGSWYAGFTLSRHTIAAFLE